MEEDFRQFTSSICSYIKKKVYQSYPIKNILFLAPMELAIIEFLHLDTCTSRHQYLLVISGNIEILPGPNQREKKKPKQLQKSCIYVILSYALDHRQHPTWSAKGIFQSHVILKDWEPHFIVPNENDSVNEWSKI